MSVAGIVKACLSQPLCAAARKVKAAERRGENHSWGGWAGERRGRKVSEAHAGGLSRPASPPWLQNCPCLSPVFPAPPRHQPKYLKPQTAKIAHHHVVGVGSSATNGAEEKRLEECQRGQAGKENQQRLG